MSKRTGWFPNPTGRVRVPQGLPVLWRLGRSSDGAWLKTTRARRKTAGLHHFFMQVERGSAWSHKPTRRSVRLRHLHPFFSERSVAANALGLGPRDRRCNSCRSDQFQVRGPVSRAPARDAGEVGAIPTHLTSFARGDEVVESALCRREVSRCESDHERHFFGGSSNS